MRNVQRVSKKTSQTISKAWKTASIAVAAATAAMAVGFKIAIDAASDLQEVQGKFDVVFADQKREAEDMAKVLVDSYAMSTREAKQYMSSIQDLLVPMGMQADKALLMSHEVVKLSADLGSFNNLPTAQVMLDIQSALVGNFETMKKYGVILNETVIKQKALEMGLWNGKGMVDANTKAQIAYKLMLEGSAAAIGDQERTMGSYANQMKLLKAQTEDISAAIGDKLLPEVTAWVEQLNIMIKQTPQAIDQIGVFAKNMLGLATAMGKVSFYAIGGFNELIDTFRAKGLAAAGVITWTEALTDATAAVERFNKLAAGPIFYKVSWPKPDQSGTPASPENLERTKEYYKQLEALAQGKRAFELKLEDEEMRMFRENLEYRLELKQQYYSDIEKEAREARILDEELEDEEMRMARELSEYYKKLEKDKNEDMKNAMMGWANSFSSTLNDMLWGAEVTFKSIAESFAKMITQMMIQQSLIAPLFDKSGGWFGAALGWLSGLGGGGVPGGRGPITYAAQGGIFPGGISGYSNQIINKPTQFAFAALKPKLNLPVSRQAGETQQL
jgi:hypothetical protein